MRSCKMHNVRFYEPKPNSGTCLALDKNTHLLALSRASGCIEVWNIMNAPFIERTIHSTLDNDTVEGLVWLQGRLFSVGLHGFLIEYDLISLAKKNQLAVTGEAAYCLDSNEETVKLAVGTEQGYLNIFCISEEEVLFEKFLDKQEGKILCLKFDKSGNFIASGSIDTIRVWDVNTGNAIHKMTTGRSAVNTPTIVWCLTITQDLTVISGDSRGKLVFWDGKIGSQIESYRSHQADILSIALSDDEKSLFCAGADPMIINFVKIHVKGDNNKWVKSIQRRVHNHDVKCLVLSGDKLYSSGVDGYLACTYHLQKTLLNYPPLLQNPSVILMKHSRRILLRYLDHLEVWSLGVVKNDTKGNKGLFPLQKKQQKLLVLEREVKDDDGVSKKESIVCCCASSDGKYLMYSTVSQSRLFNFSCKQDQKPQLKSLKLPEECGASLHATFCGHDLFSLQQTGGVCVLKVTEETVSLRQFIEINSIIKDAVVHFSVSENYLVVADAKSNVGVWKCTKNKWDYFVKLPKYKCSPTACAIQPKALNLVVAYSDQTLVEYSLQKKALTEFSKSLDESSVHGISKSFPVRNITFDPKNEMIIILHDDSNIVVINKNAKRLDEPAIKITKKTDKDDAARKTPSPPSIRTIKKYRHLVHLEWLSKDEMVAVEVTPFSLHEGLPPCLKQNTFGTK